VAAPVQGHQEFSMSTTVSRKSFLTTLGAAGVGAGLLRFASPAAAQDTDDDSRDEPEGMVEPEDWEAQRTEVYAAFTEALATELGDTTADDVDAAIRKAIMSLIDAHVSDDEMTKGQAEALKLIVATTDVPIMPGFMGMGLGPGPGMMHGGMMHGHGGHGDGMGPGRGRGRVRIRERMGDGDWDHKGGDFPMAPAAPSAPAETVPSAPEAPATPGAGA
jgi:hypothetical protein